MVGRPPALTDEQRAIIDDNMDMFPAEIKKLPEFIECEKVTRHVIRAYQTKVKKTEEPDDIAALADALTVYINRHGLPSRYHGKNNVTGFLQWLKGNK